MPDAAAAPHPQAMPGPPHSREMQEGLDRTLRPVGWALCAFYGLLLAYWAVALRPAYAVLGATWGCSTLLLAAFTVAARKGAAPQARRLLGEMMAAVVVAASLLLLAVTADPAMSIALYLTALGFGLILSSRVSLAAVTTACLLGWGILVALRGDATWASRGIALTACCVIAHVSQEVRIRLYARLARTSAAAVAAAAEAERAGRLRAEMETKTAFIRLAAHELATPLTTVLIQARALAKKEDALPDPMKRSARLLERNVQRLHHLVRDIITISQYQAGTMAATLRPVGLRGLARTAAQAYARHGLAREPEVVGPGEVTVLADPDRLVDTVARLLENAARHGGPPVVLTVERRGQQGVLAVRDAGPGLVPREELDAFRPFAVDPSRVGEGKGAGLGLAISRFHVELQGGTLEHAPGEPGAIFTISLPLAGTTALP
ncbi:MAG TPA: HAMP domain-containing sensor histidine kinase [Candidatus Thermoplasmatota archaeon]|nr:HAMP domain-containing sensor histidine kinase [Candidatus Thermoplasmatota archaeon]